MLENGNEQQVTWDMEGYGKCTFQPASPVERIAVELVRLRLYIQDAGVQKKFGSQTLGKILEEKLSELTTAVLESKITPEKKPYLIQYVPREIVIESMVMADSNENNQSRLVT